MEDLEGLDEIVGEFLVESHENLDQLDRDLVELERAPGSRELLASIFRTIHTIKGTSGFLAFSQLEAITHVGENLLAKLRDGHLTMTPGTTDVLLAMVDRVRELLASIEADGTEGKVEVADVVQLVSDVLEGRESSPAQPPASVEATAGQVVVPAVEVVADLPPEMPAVTPVAVLPDVPAEVPADVPAEAPAERRSVADASIRVDVDLLDSLMRQVGELVLTRNQIVRQTGHGEDLELTRSAQRLNQIATELQEGVMKTRMQPIDHLWAKLPRVVRDLGAACGKQVELVMVGRETELDRSLLESVKDPLTHLVRNAVDHGLESPERRTAAGKPAEGRLTLRAYHQSGQVVVEVCDDGGGIDAAAVAAKAVDKGLRTSAQVALMSQAELLHLIFTPGFSTAAAVTNVSGRGVGMDVVKTNIEAIGGTIEIESVLGRGTTCRLRIPLTLAIVPALVVECAGDTYAIGQVSLLELVALDAERAARAIEDVNGVPVHRLRGVLLPLVRLTDVLGVESTRDDGHVLIAVLQSEGRRFGLVIDRVLSTEDVVVKPLSARIKQLGAYSGATILGDGRVALILDVQGIARRALSSETVEGELDRHDAGSTANEQERWLVAGIGGGRRVALPLEVVTRLETFPRDAIELVGHREVVQYRGEVLPLLRLDHHLSVGSWRDTEPENLVVVIYQSGDRGVAIVVEEIVDIVDEAGRQSDISDRGLTGSVRIRDRVVEVLDVRDAVLAADPGFYDDVAPVGADSWDAVPALEAM